MNIFSGLSQADLKKRKKSVQPNFIQPMLATLTNHYFSSPDWIYEHKLDGVRCIAVKKNGKVNLLSRNKLNMNDEYPEIVLALENQDADNFIIDGEIVAVSKAGSDFQLLQGRMNLRVKSKISALQKKVPIAYYIFDVVYADSYDITQLPLLSRKIILSNLLSYNKVLVYTKHKFNNGIEFFKEACKKKWEGLIAKRAESEYISARSKNWLKFKCIEKQELVIGGYTSPLGSRTDFGALLVGYYKDSKFHYAGKVGTGFSFQTLAMLGKKLRALKIKTCPFVDYDGPVNSNIHWVHPELVAEFQFAQWTKEGKLRVGRYKGLREDKPARKVVKEVPI